MEASLVRDSELTERAAAAYRRARVLVYDRLAPGEPVIEGRLSSVQREAIIELLMAEADVADYRRERYDCQPFENMADCGW
jgi:hypothetical protein